MILSRKQLLWLRTRGGRTHNDVLEAGGKLYYLSRSNGEEIAKEVPSDKEIEIWLEHEKWVHCGPLMRKIE